MKCVWHWIKVLSWEMPLVQGVTLDLTLEQQWRSSEVSLFPPTATTPDNRPLAFIWTCHETRHVTSSHKYFHQTSICTWCLCACQPKRIPVCLRARTSVCVRAHLWFCICVCACLCVFVCVFAEEHVRRTSDTSACSSEPAHLILCLSCPPWQVTPSWI